MLDAIVTPFYVLQLGKIVMPVSWLVLVGLVGNILFTGRVVLQWIVSERERRSVVPVAFWWVSIVATLIHMVYALLRRDQHNLPSPDLPMFFGLAITLLPYIRNLRIHYHPDRPARGRGPIVAIGALLLVVLLVVVTRKVEFQSWWIFTLGVVGNIVFRSRFIVAWIQSESQRKAVLPQSFWYLSMTGSVILLLYSLLRGDIVFLLSFLFNVVPSVRNVILLRREQAGATLAPSD